jgi:5-methylcytosine-specific restriction protein A
VKLPTLKSSIPRFDLSRVKPPAKQADPYYLSPEHRAWRELVIRRADGRCEWVDDGIVCGRREKRMFANHIVEIRDDPSRRLDPTNGNCLCGRHHTLWTNRQRQARQG